MWHFFSAINAQSLKKKRGKKNVKDKQDVKESDDADELLQSSQLTNSTSQQWIDSHPTIVNIFIGLVKPQFDYCSIV